MQLSHTFLAAARSLVAAIVVGLIAAPAIADTQSFDVSVQNTGASALTCDAAFAHWYSDTFGDVTPGATLHMHLRADPATGTVALRNTQSVDMPVQRLWCGHKGASWATRAEIVLERKAGIMPAAITLTCAATASATTCTPH